MKETADTQALVWLRALKTEMKDIQKNVDFCIRGQAAGKLTQEDFDEFVGKMSRFAQHVIQSTGGETEG